jgi:hypothetical protein
VAAAGNASRSAATATNTLNQTDPCIFPSR